jgi:predicted acylesterase/phospholipase RssA
MAEIGEDGYCRALAMRGGGTKGIYDVGVLEAFLDNLPIEDIGYDVITGVSIGAVNGGTLAIFEKGDEADAIALLRTYWNDTSTDGLFQEWPYVGPIAGFWKNSFVDMTPSHERIKERFMGKDFAREVSF